MPCTIRRAHVPVTVVLVLVWFAIGCSGASSGAVGTGGEGGASLGVQISPGFVTVENRTDQLLVDTKVTVRAGSLRYTYAHSLSRLAPGEKRNLPFADFTLPDGSRLAINLRRPNEVLVTAVDANGMKYEGSVPWRL